MSHSNASEQKHDPAAKAAPAPAQLVREYLAAAEQRLNAVDLVEAQGDVVWAIRDLRWAMHHLLEVVEGVS